MWHCFFPKKESACEGKSTHGIVDSEVDPSRFMDSHKDAYPLKTWDPTLLENSPF